MKRASHSNSSVLRALRRQQSQRGFTLLELLVVLAIVGLISAVAVPQFATLSDRVEFAMNRERLERSINGFPYLALRNHQDLVLGRPKKPDTTDFNSETEAPIAFAAVDDFTGAAMQIEGPVLVVDAPLDLPQGWTIDAPKPIVFRSTGLCSGGELNVRVDNFVYTYVLRAPRCEVELK